MMTDELTTDATPETAPYGFKKDGTPYKRRPPVRKKTKKIDPESVPREAAEFLSKINTILAGTLLYSSVAGKVLSKFFPVNTPDLSATAESIQDMQPVFVDEMSKALTDCPGLAKKLAQMKMPGDQNIWAVASIGSIYGKMCVALLPVLLDDINANRG